MVYNGDSTNQDIVSMSEKLVKANSVSFPIADKTLYANEAMRWIWSWIHQAYGGWVYDDKNYTTFPEATTNLVASQSDYSFPLDSSMIMGVEVKDQSGVWNKMTPVTLEQIQDVSSDGQFLNVASFPSYYRLIGSSVKLYPAPNFSQSASIKIYYTRDISAFTTTDTTKTPGFDSMYHEAVPTYMAYRYAGINSIVNYPQLQLDWINYEKRIKGDYSRRFHELFPARMTTRDAMVEFS